MYEKHTWIHIGSGKTSKAYVNNDKTIVCKQYIDKNENQYRNEIKLLEMVSGLPHFPTLLKIDRMNKYIYMSYCGERVNKGNIPVNWDEQLNEIFSTFDNLGIIHNDSNRYNFLVNEGILYQIDFGHTINNGRRYKQLNDKYKQMKRNIFTRLMK